MTNTNLISDLIKGKKVDQPIELNVDQALLLEIARDIHVIRSSVGGLAFLAFVGLIIGILSAIF